VANGKPGDHPITDILVWNRDVYGTELDSLVREVCALSEAQRLDGDSGETADPLGEPRMIELLFAAETDASLRPELKRELLTLRARLRASEPS
jgi:hypothetical protein